MKSGTKLALGITAAAITTGVLIQVVRAATRGGGGAGFGSGSGVHEVGGGGLVFGRSGAPLPGGWNPLGNDVRFGEGCNAVFVGRQFWRTFERLDLGELGSSYVLECREFGSMRECIDAGQNVCCFIDFLMNQRSITSARQIGEEIIAGLEPPCLDIPSSKWPAPMRAFVDWLRPQVNEYVQEASGQADW